MATLFTKIINGEVPCHKIAEDEDYFAFLDIRPIRLGHTLVIPKKETDYIFDLDDDVLKGLICFAKKIVPGIEKSVECKRVGIMVAGLEVPHCHVHLIPIDDVKDLSFSNAKETSSDELAKVADEIRTHL